MTNSYDNGDGSYGYGEPSGDDLFNQAEELRKQGKLKDAQDKFNEAAQEYQRCGDKANADTARKKANSL